MERQFLLGNFCYAYFFSILQTWNKSIKTDENKPDEVDDSLI